MSRRPEVYCDCGSAGRRCPPEHRSALRRARRLAMSPSCLPPHAPAKPEAWTDEMSDETLALLSDEDLDGLTTLRAELEERLPAERRVAEAAAARRRLEADYAREVRRVTAEAAARNASRDDRERERRTALEAADAAEARALAARDTPRRLPAHYAAGLAELLLGSVMRLAAGLAFIILLTSLFIGGPATAEGLRHVAETLGRGLGSALGSLPDFAEGVRDGQQIGGR